MQSITLLTDIKGHNQRIKDIALFDQKLEDRYIQRILISDSEHLMLNGVNMINPNHAHKWG